MAALAATNLMVGDTFLIVASQEVTVR